LYTHIGALFQVVHAGAKPAKGQSLEAQTLLGHSVNLCKHCSIHWKSDTVASMHNSLHKLGVVPHRPQSVPVHICLD